MILHTLLIIAASIIGSIVFIAGVVSASIPLLIASMVITLLGVGGIVAISNRPHITN